MNEDTKNPLWMPRGSVRALIALGLVTAVVSLAILGKELPKEIVGFAGAAFGYYFAARQNQ